MVNFSDCSNSVQLFACIGMAVAYLFVGALIGKIFVKLLNPEDEDLVFVMSAIAWPFVLIALVLYAIGMWFLTPIWAATKEDLRNTERRLSNKIYDECSQPLVFSDTVEEMYNPPFKVGDIITGLVPQTDYRGDNISYNHLYQGCKCRVLDIDSDGSMKIILLDHKDKEAHRSVIGKTFIAPARNFTLVKKTYSKRKAVKKSKR